MFLRDGATGNTSGFELEDEGSIPSPAARLFSATRMHEPDSLGFPEGSLDQPFYGWVTAAILSVRPFQTSLPVSALAKELGG